MKNLIIFADQTTEGILYFDNYVVI